MFKIPHCNYCSVNTHAKILLFFWLTQFPLLQCWHSYQNFALFLIRKRLCLIQFNLSPSVAQLSWDFHYFSCFPSTVDIFIDVDKQNNILPLWSSSSMTMIFSTNQRPRNWLGHHTTHNTQQTTENQLTGRHCSTSRRLQKQKSPQIML